MPVVLVTRSTDLNDSAGIPNNQTDAEACDTEPRLPQLIYFNLRGRGELIRLVFATGGLKLEQVRMDLGDWTKMKPLMKTGQVPTLEVTKSNGEIEQLSESGAIVRALARMLGMMGDSDRDYYNIEKALGQIGDIEKEISLCLMRTGEQKDEILKSLHEADAKVDSASLLNALMKSGAEKESGIKYLLEKKLPSLLKNLATSLKEAGGKHFAGEKISLADLSLINLMDQLEGIALSLLKAEYKELIVFKENLIAGCPKLAEYLKSRPVTPM